MLKLLVALYSDCYFGQAAQAQTPFYQGKTITIVVGTKAGDAYDLYPRMLAEFMPKYIPGNPNIIIQNVPGAASMIAANQVYNVSQTGRLDHRRHLPGALFRAADEKTRSQIRLDQVRLDWQSGNVEPCSLHARGRAVQIHGRYP